MTNEFYLFLIFACSALDAARDGFRSPVMNGISDRGWHVIKWLAFYPPMIVVMFQLTGWYFICSPLVGLAGWQFGILFTPVRWKSQWVKWAVIGFNKLKAMFK